MKKILFLHTELAGYFLSCVNTLINIYEAEVHVVKLPVNKEAPFQFELNSKIRFYNRHDYSEKDLIELSKKISPDFIFCAGWIDNAYLKICKFYFGEIPTVIVLDNHYSATLKQKSLCFVSRFLLLNKFSNIWVPGLYQYEYARRLGFNKEKILTGMYSADVDFFHKHYLEHKSEKENKFPKRFLYVGRYIEMKGVKELWQAFIELQNEEANEWELWCAGTGNLEKEFPKHSKIKNLGFVQPNEIGDLIKDSGVFVLPSHYEPWGVVVHEFTAAGMPMICSNQVAAAAQFLVNGYNGYSFESNNKESLKQAMCRIMNSSDESLLNMGRRSIELSNSINPTIWATKIWALIKK